VVRKVEVDVVLVVAPGDALPAKENIFVERRVRGAASKIGFIERVAACSIPVDGAVGFLDAFAVAVVTVGDAGCGGEMVFSIVI
jgi:hypothetical protein